jgi:sigma-B regulation protein RsbU (phosphoserine phosphatase)
VPLGLLENREYEEVQFQTQPGDTLVLYSDGIPDQTNQKGEEYARGRLSKVVRAHCGLSAQALTQRIFKDLDRFSAGAGKFDDQTLLVMKVK